MDGEHKNAVIRSQVRKKKPEREVKHSKTTRAHKVRILLFTSYQGTILDGALSSHDKKSGKIYYPFTIVS